MSRYRLIAVMVFIVLTASGSRGWTEIEDKAVDKSTDKSTADINAIISRLDYPELQVVPRASERLKMEAKEEEYDWSYAHWQIEISGVATLANSILASNELRENLNDTQTQQSSQVNTVGKVVGLGWIAGGLIIGMSKPYHRSLNSLLKYNGKDERSILMRERLAEETIESEARLMRSLVWFSAISQFGTNVLVGSFLTDQGRVVAGISAFFSLFPLIFEDHAITLHDKSLEYKTRIYRPISSLDMGYDARGRTYVPMARLTWNY